MFFVYTCCLDLSAASAAGAAVNSPFSDAKFTVVTANAIRGSLIWYTYTDRRFVAA